jgi:thermostable 8-oxoguanine DNA glycosylase
MMGTEVRKVFHVRGDPTALKTQLVPMPLRDIDPFHITCLDRSNVELGNFFVFCCLVAGKNAVTTAARVNRMVDEAPDGDLLTHMAGMSMFAFKAYLRKHKVGQYYKNGMALSYVSMMGSRWLHKATFEELMEIHGIGPKTAAFFIMHSRPDPKVAVLDRHILRWMGEPDKTPASLTAYMRLSDKFIKHARMRGMHPAELDLKIWTKMREKNAKSK